MREANPLSLQDDHPRLLGCDQRRLGVALGNERRSDHRGRGVG